jgi:hypothetical protein
MISALSKNSGARSVLGDRRKRARRLIKRGAKFCSSDGALPRDCMIVDMSEGGARLYCDAHVPQTFTLAISGEGVDERRDCRVVWRLGGELGVEFTDRPRR